MPGISLGFILLCFVPLVLAVLACAALARKNHRRWAKIPTGLWRVACVPAGLMILVGYAFNPHGMHPLLQVAAWFGAGALRIWLPLLAKEAIARRFTK